MGLKVITRIVIRKIEVNWNISQVYAVSSGSSKRELALSLGAYDYLDSKTTNVVEYLQSLGGANLIICTAPYSDAISAIIPAVARNGNSPSSTMVSPSY